MKKFVVIDGNSLVHRAYHALPPMNGPDGSPTNAIYGFLSMMLKMLDEERPDYLLAAFDTHAPTPRHIRYEDYKAKRQPTPDDLKMQFPVLKEILREMGIAVGEQDGYEADDYLGIFSRRGEDKGVQVALLTGDKDALQLVDDAVTVILMRKGISDTVRYDEAAIREQYGVTPKQMIEVKGLMGDSSDNIPGVPGVGEKTALKLIQEYGNMEEVFAHVEELKGPKLRENMKTYREQAEMSREIGRIIIDVDAPIDLTVEECAFDSSKMIGARKIMQEMGLRSLVGRLPKGEDGADEGEIEDLPIWKLVELADESAFQAVLPQMLSAARLGVAYSLETMSVSDGQTLWTLPIQRSDDLLSEGWRSEDALQSLAILFVAETPKCVYDAKWYWHELDALDTVPQKLDMDLMLAVYLLEPNRSQPEVATLAQEQLGLEEDHAGILLSLWDIAQKRMEEEDLLRVYGEIELPLVPVLFRMEKQGFLVDKDVLAALGAEYDLSIDALGREIHEMSGNPDFNILSPKQLGTVLFEEMGLPAPRKGKNGYPTDATTLEALQGDYPIVGKVLEYRQNTKLRSTYITGLSNAADGNGRIHTQFKQNVAATGRLSSIEPNLQNIPIRSQLGRVIRKAFVPEAGCVLVSADYSQIELRILAHLSEDEGMIDAFLAGEDIHTATAAAVAGVALNEVTPEMRSAAKATNFGIVYGISDFGLSQQLGISRHQADDYIQAYFARYPKIKAYMDEVIAHAKETGYVTTIFGRRRNLPELRSSNYYTRSFGERAARNAPIQGSAADIIKLAMIRVEQTLEEKNLASKLILQVHDELILNVLEAEKEEVEQLLCWDMENVVELKVPLLVEVGAGKNWYDAK